MKSRIISTEYDDMAGLGSFPAGLFLYLGERYARNVAGLKKEMHLLWTITIKRPGYKRIVHSIDFSSYKSEYVGKLEIDGLEFYPAMW